MSGSWDPASANGCTCSTYLGWGSGDVTESLLSSPALSSPLLLPSSEDSTGAGVAAASGWGTAARFLLDVFLLRLFGRGLAPAAAASHAAHDAARLSGRSATSCGLARQSNASRCSPNKLTRWLCRVVQPQDRSRLVNPYWGVVRRFVTICVNVRRVNSSTGGLHSH